MALKNNQKQASPAAISRMVVMMGKFSLHMPSSMPGKRGNGGSSHGSGFQRRCKILEAAKVFHFGRRDFHNGREWFTQKRKVGKAGKRIPGVFA